MALYAQGYCFVAGLDEAGRGCLAGPVVAAAVMLPLHDTVAITERLARVNDSKLLTCGQRERLYEVITQQAISFGVGIGPVELIDKRNILQATRQAMRDALAQLSPPPQALLLDAVELRDIALPQRAIIKGDRLCLSIAAASIIAKVTRDRLMLELHKQYPDYGFDRHKGYGTPAHLEAIQCYGITPHHRRSFSPIRELCYGLFANLES
ncbi:MAG: ribonuclease HII [Ktedonobacteraceae bacterium]|nr:ribonuclease HII [Ktedonobacteraceae bacterium]